MVYHGSDHKSSSPRRWPQTERCGFAGGAIGCVPIVSASMVARTDMIFQEAIDTLQTIIDGNLNKAQSRFISRRLVDCGCWSVLTNDQSTTSQQNSCRSKIVFRIWRIFYSPRIRGSPPPPCCSRTSFIKSASTFSVPSESLYRILTN
jgi:hypothetical protein